MEEDAYCLQKRVILREVGEAFSLEASTTGCVGAAQVLSIDGNVVDEEWTGDRAAHFLRGSTGTSVRVSLARRSLQVPGVAGRPEMPPKVGPCSHVA